MDVIVGNSKSNKKPELKVINLKWLEIEEEVLVCYIQRETPTRETSSDYIMIIKVILL